VDQARYAELFATEAREHLAEMDSALLAFEQQADPAHVATLFRSMHTIKGMAAAMGYRAVEQLAHALESLLDGARRGESIARDDLLALLFDGTDALRASVDEAVSGRGHEVPAALTPLLQRLGAGAQDAVATGMLPAPTGSSAADGLAGLTHGAQFDDAGSVPARPVTANATVTVEVRLTADCPLKGVRAMLVASRLESMGAVQRIVPPRAAWNADHFDGTFTVTLSTRATADELETAARAAGDVARVIVGAVAATPPRHTAAEALRTVRVDRRRLDTLPDLVGGWSSHGIACCASRRTATTLDACPDPCGARDSSADHGVAARSAAGPHGARRPGLRPLSSPGARRRARTRQGRATRHGGTRDRARSLVARCDR
jgi:two-component system chemotaxis sensor kinase CheA